jgi:LPXTG-motif cell wall-anchored protein
MIWDEDYDNEDGTFGKWVKVSSSNVGDVVDFKVTFTATNYDGETKIEKYTINDALSSAWADIDTTSIKVTVGGTELAGDAFTVTPVGNDVTTRFTLEIPWVNNDTDKTFKYISPSDVEITYSATVRDAAASADPANKNNKNHVTSGWDSEGDQTTTKVYNLGFAKVDGTNGKPLPGAKFGLYSDENCTIPVNVTPVDGTQGVYMVGGTSNEVETYDDGQVVIQGLEAGTYYLKENTPPAGYNALTEAVAVVVSGDINNTEKIKDSYTVNNEKLDIENNTGMELPSTGGKGTMMLITIGSMVAMAFAVLLITHKKMSVYHD